MVKCLLEPTWNMAHSSAKFNYFKISSFKHLCRLVKAWHRYLGWLRRVFPVESLIQICVPPLQQKLLNGITLKLVGSYRSLFWFHENLISSFENFALQKRFVLLCRVKFMCICDFANTFVLLHFDEYGQNLANAWVVQLRSIFFKLFCKLEKDGQSY